LKKSNKNKAGSTKVQPSPGKPEASAGKSAIKEMTPEEKRQVQVENIIKTAVAAFVGIIEGIIVYFWLGVADTYTWYAILTIILILAYYAQRLIFPPLKIDTKEFGFKGWFYVEFIVLDFCLVTWVLLLN
jgi:hypothetical protein